MGCNHDCDSCNESCSKEESMKEKLNPLSSVKKVIGIVSGKGGVGKSLVTALLASAMRKKGKTVAVLDADVTGPSIPKIFGIKEKAVGTAEGLYPAVTKSGVRVMSVNLLLGDDTDPVLWRGPVIGGAVKQFWTDVVWSDVDFMFLDMPPGTGDVALTVFQSLPVDGLIIVTSPQQLSNMIVSKAVKMAQMMKIPVLGLVENMSYFVCPDCGKKIEVFGESNAHKTAEKFGLRLLARLPIDPELAELCDNGLVENASADEVAAIADILEQS